MILLNDQSRAMTKFSRVPKLQDGKLQFHILSESGIQYGRHLKTVYTIGNCQRAVFSLGVSQHMDKITNL